MTQSGSQTIGRLLLAFFAAMFTATSLADDGWVYLGDNESITNAEARHGAKPDLVWMRYDSRVLRGINGAYVETGEIGHDSELIQIDCKQKTQRVLLWNGHAQSGAPRPLLEDFLHATLYEFVCHRPL